MTVSIGLGRVTQNGPMDNSDFSAPNCILIAAPHATCRPHWTKNARSISDQRVYPADNPAGKQQKALSAERPRDALCHLKSCKSLHNTNDRCTFRRNCVSPCTAVFYQNVVKPSTTTRICRPRWGYPTGIFSKIFGIRKLVPGLSRFFVIGTVVYNETSTCNGQQRYIGREKQNLQKQVSKWIGLCDSRQSFYHNSALFSPALTIQ